MTDRPPCSDCDGRCCRWILVAYSEREAEVSKLRGARIVFIDDKPAFFAFRVVCAMLAANGLCKIYSRRPAFCREEPAEPGGFICRVTRLLEKEKEGIIKLP